MSALVSVQVGRIMPLGSDGVPSGFAKSPLKGPVAVGTLGLAGDAQADLSVHGGRDKAVYLYPVEHYEAWRRDLPEHAPILLPGGFGENLTVSGLNEEMVCLGDILRIGSALLQVTQFRQPCFKLALRFADNRLPRLLLRSGRSGWYARVLEEGSLQQGDHVVLVARLNPAWAVSRLARLVTHRSATLEEMVELSDLPGLAAYWHRTADVTLEQFARRRIRLAATSGPASPSSLA